MDKVKVSIIIPVYNSEVYLDACVAGILKQDMTSYEVILVDDGSTDSSPLICDRLSSTDSRFRTIHKSNGGVSSARNAGIALAQGEYVTFIDSDDILAPGALKAMAEATAGSPDLVVGGFDIYQDEILYASICPPAADSFPSGKVQDFFSATVLDSGELYRGPWAKLYRLSIIKKNSLRFDECLSYAEDKLFIYEFLGHITSGATVDVPVYQYFRRPGTLSGGKTTLHRLAQLYDVVPLCAEALLRLMDKYPEASSLQKIYHNDIVCFDIMRILRTFLKCRTDLLSESSLKTLYSLLERDDRLRVFERKVPGQVINTLLYKIGNVRLSLLVYRSVSMILYPFYA